MARGDYANSGSTYPSNAVQGWLQGIDESCIFDVDVRAKFAIGSGFKRADGNIYRYINTITGVAAGKLVAHNGVGLDVAYATSMVVLGTSATQQGGDPIGTYPSLINSRYILISLASITKDQFAGGYVTVARGTGAPYSYRIKGNSASATVNSVANSVIIELYDQLQASLAASTTTYLSIVGSPYNYMELCTGTGTMATTNYIGVGVAQATLAANNYGWICTNGVTTCLADGTLTAGCMISASAATAGAVQQFGVGTTSNASNVLFVNQPLGYCIDPAATTYYATIYLQAE
jgi:hypothetical protein